MTEQLFSLWEGSRIGALDVVGGIPLPCIRAVEFNSVIYAGSRNEAFIVEHGSRDRSEWKDVEIDINPKYDPHSMIQHALRQKLYDRLNHNWIPSGCLGQGPHGMRLISRSTPRELLTAHAYIARTDRLCAQWEIKRGEFEVAIWRCWTDETNEDEVLGPGWELTTRRRKECYRFDNGNVPALADVERDQPMAALLVCLALDPN